MWVTKRRMIMQNLGLVLLAFAFVTAVISIFIPTVNGKSLLSLALAFWIASELLGGLGRSAFLH